MADDKDLKAEKKKLAEEKKKLKADEKKQKLEVKKRAKELADQEAELDDVFYSLSDATIEQGEGEILTMKFTPKAVAPEGNYTLHITNIKLGTPDMVDKYAGNDETCTFKVKKLIGDVNRDGLVNIADVTALVNIILGKDLVEPYIYDHDAADVNQDTRINITDVTGLVNIILGKQ